MNRIIEVAPLETIRVFPGGHGELVVLKPATGQPADCDCGVGAVHSLSRKEVADIESSLCRQRAVDEILRARCPA